MVEADDASPSASARKHSERSLMCLQKFAGGADGGLCRPHGFSRAREAAKLGDADESLDSVEVEGPVHHFNSILLKS
jgi:hypothetical protein